MNSELNAMSCNPYEPPIGPLVEKFATSRANLAYLIQRLLNRELTVYEGSELLEPYWNSSDPSSRFVAEIIDEFCNCSSHDLLALNKPEWDLVQRLLLVLDAHCNVERTAFRFWSASQPLAILAFAAFVYCAVHVGWNGYLCFLMIPFGLVCLGISKLQSAIVDRNRKEHYLPIVYPFATFGDLCSAHRSTSFVKVKFPKGLAVVESNEWQWLQLPLRLACFFLLSPVALLFQSLPNVVCETKVTCASE